MSLKQTRHRGLKLTKNRPINIKDIKPILGRGQSPLIPLVLWSINVAWVMRVTVFIRQRATDQFSAVDISAGAQIALVFLAMTVIMMSGRLQLAWHRVNKTSLRMLIYYYIFTMISAIWSSSVSYTFYRGMEFLILFGSSFIALTYAGSFIKAERAVLFNSVIVIVLSIYVNLKLGGFSISSTNWHTNSYSASGAILFCYCLGEYFRASGIRKKSLRNWGLFGLAATALGTSAASNISVMFGVLVIAFLRRNTSLLILSVFLFIILLPLILFFANDYSVIMSILFPGKTEEQIVTAHGRTDMWLLMFSRFLERPVIGHGFAVLSSSRGHLFSSDPHNSLLSILLGTGIIGFLFVLIYGVRLIREFSRSFNSGVNRPGAVGSTAAILTGLVNSLSMPLVFSEWEESSFVFACVTSFFILFVYLPLMQEKSTKKPR